MKSTFNCPIHPSEVLAWICLEQGCSMRLLCSCCAVKSHDKFHRVEEVKTLEERGFKGLVAESLTGHLLNAKSFESYEETLKEAFEILKKNIISDLEGLKAAHYEFVSQVNKHNSQLSGKAMAFEESDNVFRRGFNSVDEMKVFLNNEIANAHGTVNDVNIGEASAIKFKGELLDILSGNFVRIQTLLLSNSYLTSLSSLLQQQTESVINTPNLVSNAPQFLSFVDGKIRREWNSVEENLTKGLSGLSNHLNTILNNFPMNSNMMRPTQIQFPPQQLMNPQTLYVHNIQAIQNQQNIQNLQTMQVEQDSASKRYRMNQYSTPAQSNVLVTNNKTRQTPKNGNTSNSKKEGGSSNKREFFVPLTFVQQENKKAV